MLLLLAGLLLVACNQPTTPEEDDPKENPPGSGYYSEEEIDYFMEIALGSEYGSPEVVKKWTRDLRVTLKGAPTPADSSTMETVVDELNDLVGNQVQLVFDNRNPNVTAWFVPVDSMENYNTNYKPGNWGYFYIWWNSSYQIYRAQILIGTDKPSQTERSHLIREELTQSLGLMNDSDEYPGSIFQAEWTRVQEYTDLDSTIIEMLYRPEIHSGMGAQEVRSVLDTLEASTR